MTLAKEPHFSSDNEMVEQMILPGYILFAAHKHVGTLNS